MKKIKILLMGLGLLGLNEAGIAAQLEHTLTFSPELLSLSTDTLESSTFTVVKYPDLCFDSGIAGKPQLPVKYIRFAVPVSAGSFSVSVNYSGGESVRVDYPVMPVQNDVPADGRHNEPVIALDLSSDELYPSVAAKIVDEGYLYGVNHYVTVAVYPVSYDNGNSALHICRQMTVNLSYSEGTTTPLGMRPLFPSRQSNTELSYVKASVINPQVVADFSKKVPTSFMAVESQLPIYDYCVITTRKLAPAFERLLGWKRQKGYNAGCVCVEDILSDPAFSEGDVVSGINDDAGKIRAYLQYAYQNGETCYVLFGGNADVLPIRYGNIPTDVTNGIPHPFFSNIPTDLYFSDLNGNWDMDNDGLYGETKGAGDAVDYAPELFVGRLLCSTAEEVALYTEKLIRYEYNPGNGDYAYLKKAFLNQSDEMLRDRQADIIADLIEPFIPESTIFSEYPAHTVPPTFPTGTDCITEMNNRYGFFSWHGHGNPDGVSTKSNPDKSNYYGIVATQKNRSGLVAESGHGLDCLTNYDYPAIAYSMSCTLTPFEPYVRIVEDDVYNFKPYFGASYTVGGMYGGPVFLGNTRYGYVIASQKLEEAFIKELLDGSWNLGKVECLSKYSTTSPDHYVRLAHNLIGCPELEMWSDIPAKYEDVQIVNNGNNVSVFHPELAGARVILVSASGTTAADAESDNVTFADVDTQSFVMICKRNRIPYISPLEWENGSLRSQNYMIADTAAIGGGESGQFEFTDGCDVTIEAFGEVVFGKNCIVRSGANVKILSHSKVTFTGGTVEDGATLIVEAPAVSMESNFEAEAGASVQINNQ